ncbi:aspergillopepsin-2 precursor [Trichoderma arundinaceum]|uniref:Aspergillopepsin-2 n=1 Tax=Trichoderma arundinaceum TaxID=490622 RepID=A0A395N922_TRIAR|nr:aspergillopepsin-2 precursor [Trichoderma arundinaceum]
MKSIALAASILLVANAALASPLAARKQAAMDAIRARNSARRSNGFRAGSNHVNGTADVESTNWAGAAITTSGITEVSGTFTVPQPSVPAGGSSQNEYCGAAWVGIDGYSNADLIQTGVLWCIQDGEFLYEAWYEYLPASLIAYSGISVGAGSVVTVTATKTGTNSGVTTLSSGGRTVSHTFSRQNSPLPGTSAEWIVEDFTSGSSLVPFADFGSVTFTGASAIVNGATVTPGGDAAVIIDLEDASGDIITSTNVSGGTVTVNYE